MNFKYTVTDLGTGLQQNLNNEDQNLIGSFKVNTLFSPLEDTLEVYLFVENRLFDFNKNVKTYRVQFDSESAGKKGASRIVLDPLTDLKAIDIVFPEIELEYRYYKELFKKGVEYFIEEFSEDRTEVRLLTFDLTDEELIELGNLLKQRFESDSTFTGFYITGTSEERVFATNVEVLPYNNSQSIVLKLYQEADERFEVKTQVKLFEEISDTTRLLVTSEPESSQQQNFRIADPNFNIEVNNIGNVDSDYYNLDTLLSLDAAYSPDLLELRAKVEEKSIELNIDYTKFENFINFSSAVERLENFKYKVELIQGYEASIAGLDQGTSTSVTRKKLEFLIEGIVRNFDHYEKFLFFEKSDVAWPKLGTEKPYTLYPVASQEVQTWYQTILDAATAFDLTNANNLVGTVPSYLKEDDRNAPYLLFVNMVGHQFDNLWIYTKAVSTKYNADNRLNTGVSKDLIEEVLKNFGIKLYSDQTSTEDLYRYFTTGGYDEQGEVINTYVTGGEQISAKDYSKELYKRIYHNLPLLLKTKGTERSIKTLITCFGIPSDRLIVKQFGGRDKKQLPYLGLNHPVLQEENKLRQVITDREGSTLSIDTEILQRDVKIDRDLHRIEVGFSPVDSINDLILSQIDPLFSIDNYIGDPSGKGYKELKKVAKSLLSNLNRFDIKDFVRLIKFFDNRLFKMIKDFAPARVVVDTGVIVKSHLLERNKYEDFRISTFEETLEGTVDTAFITGSSGGTFGARQDYITSWVETVQTPDGKVNKPQINRVGRMDGETPRYTGEFSGSFTLVTDGELNRDNPFKKLKYKQTPYNVGVISSASICFLSSGPGTVYITQQGPYNITQLPFFDNTTEDTNYLDRFRSTITVPTSVTFSSASYNQGEAFELYAERSESCTATASVEIAYCTLGQTTGIPSNIEIDQTYDLTSWFTKGSIHGSEQEQYIITTADLDTYTLNPIQASSYIFTSSLYNLADSPVSVKMKIPSLDGKPTECATVVTRPLGASTNPVVNYYFATNNFGAGTLQLDYTPGPSVPVTHIGGEEVTTGTIVTTVNTLVGITVQNGSAIPAGSSLTVLEDGIEIYSEFKPAIDGNTINYAFTALAGKTYQINSGVNGDDTSGGLPPGVAP